MNPPDERLREILKAYNESFSGKAYNEENDDHDVLMDVFGLKPELKRENRQYWGRELGMCWQLLVTALFEATTSDYKSGYREGVDELCDLISGTDAIDTKYRIGSGDSGTLKKFKQYGKRLSEIGYQPVLLIVRSDNLPAAVGACNVGGWKVYTAADTFEYVRSKTGVDFTAWLKSLGTKYHVTRK